MFGKLAAFLLVCVLCGSVPAYSQTLHVISVADSNDGPIGAGTAANSKALQSYATLVATLTKLSLNFTPISGDKFTCTEILKSVAELQAKPNDVIMFYYSGHGFAPESDPSRPGTAAASLFPWFYCNPAASRPNLEAISKELKAKGARLVITVADTCNVILPVTETPLAAKGVIEERIRAMFLNYKGSILITSSKREQASWYYPSGGIFTAKFFQLLRDPPEIDHSKLWDAVLEKAREKIMVSSPGQRPVIQEPEIPVPELVFVR
jgi:hypothetical protein